MRLKVEFQDFAEKYSSKSSEFYPEALELRKRNLDISEIKEKLQGKVPEDTVYGWLHYEKIPIAFKQFQELKTEFVDQDIEYLGTVVGHVLGDGGIDKDYTLHYCNTEKFLINELRETMDKVFGVRSKIYREESGIMRLRYGGKFSRALKSLFGNFAEGYKQDKSNKRITDEIEEMPKEWKIVMLRALYADDGSVPKTQQYISLKQKHKEIISWVQEFLAKIGIKSGLTRDESRWLLRIAGYSNLLKFKEKVNFSQGYRKRNQLCETIEEINFPHWQTKKKIAKFLKGGAKTRKEITRKIDEVSKGTIHYHLHGSKVSEDSGRKDIPGLVALGVVGVNKEEREYSYYISSLQKYKQLLSNDLSFR